MHLREDEFHVYVSGIQIQDMQSEDVLKWSAESESGRSAWNVE